MKNWLIFSSHSYLLFLLSSCCIDCCKEIQQGFSISSLSFRSGIVENLQFDVNSPVYYDFKESDEISFNKGLFIISINDYEEVKNGEVIEEECDELIYYGIDKIHAVHIFAKLVDNDDFIDFSNSFSVYYLTEDLMLSIDEFISNSPIFLNLNDFILFKLNERLPMQGRIDLLAEIEFDDGKKLEAPIESILIY